MPMGYSFVELRPFMERRSEFFATDDDFPEFQRVLAEAPERGDVIPGCGGMRKVRWRDERRGKGKRGGCGVVYVHCPPPRGSEGGLIYLVDAFGKNEKEDLSAHDRKVLMGVAQALRAAAERV